MNKSIVVKTPSELVKVTSELRSMLTDGRNIVLLEGNLGAGKTALVKEYVKEALELKADSPTFNLVNTYSSNSIIIHHFDLYRLNSVDEIEDIGFWDYVDSSDLCFIEWPDKIAELLPLGQVIKVNIALSSNQWREYSLSYS